MVDKIISGGQTGADRAGLDVALELGLGVGGWIPRGRRAEDGKIPEHYDGLVETDSDAYEDRTELNVRDSDATVVLAFGPPTGGSALTVKLARSLGKPLLTLDLERRSPEETIDQLRSWLTDTRPRVLNVAGPRLSKEPRIEEATREILRGALRPAPAERGFRKYLPLIALVVLWPTDAHAQKIPDVLVYSFGLALLAPFAAIPLKALVLRRWPIDISRQRLWRLCAAEFGLWLVAYPAALTVSRLNAVFSALPLLILASAVLHHHATRWRGAARPGTRLAVALALSLIAPAVAIAFALIVLALAQGASMLPG